MACVLNVGAVHIPQLSVTDLSESEIVLFIFVTHLQTEDFRSHYLAPSENL